MKPAAPGGSWPSALGPAQVAAAQLRLMQPKVADGDTYWVESRPAEGGRAVLVRERGGEILDLTPQPFSVRTRVHEYGGGAYAVASGRVWFCNDADQCIYELAEAPRRLTVPGTNRYADLTPDLERRRLLCVCEDHADVKAVRNFLAAVSLDDGVAIPLLEGRDFVSSPALSPDGRQLAWLAWDHPQMPWDGCELWLAELDPDGGLHAPRRIAGGPDESIFQPRWSPDGVLHFVSDRSGFWNLYRYTDGMVTALAPDAADYGYAQWVLGMSSYGFLSAHELVSLRLVQGRAELVRLDARSGMRTPLAPRYTHIEHVDAEAGGVVFIGGAADALPAVLRALPAASLRELRRAGSLPLPVESISRPRAVNFATSNGARAHAWYYPPVNPERRLPGGSTPPLIVRCHGGPTSMNGEVLDPKVQFWTSRGFAFADLNYRGSTGYGRDYRRSLRGQWGVRDAEDAVHLLRHLVAEGLADPERAAVSGSSAGGYTALCALAFHAGFGAGAVQYGISELETAMTGTHKFEARYGDTLLGPWPEARAIYRERSPLHSAGHIRVPVLFFQGLKDTVVLPDQAARMVEALDRNGVPVACLTFAEEGHGFRRAETVTAVLEAELAFYARVFGFMPTLVPPSLVIRNLL